MKSTVLKVFLQGLGELEDRIPLGSVAFCFLACVPMFHNKAYNKTNFKLKCFYGEVKADCQIKFQIIIFLATSRIQTTVRILLEKRQVKKPKLDPGLESMTDFHGLSFLVMSVALRLRPPCTEVQTCKKAELQSASALCLRQEGRHIC